MLLSKLSCGVLKGVGPRIADRLSKLDIHTIQDLLFHLPLRYEDRTRIVKIGGLRPYYSATIEGRIILTEIVRRGRTQLLCRVSDETGFITLRFFHFTKMQSQRLSHGNKIRCFGEVRLGKTGYEMVHPEYHLMTPHEIVPVEQFLTPIYPTTEGLHQLSWRKMMKQVLDLLDQDNQLQELLPEDILKQYQFPSLKKALRFLHQPPHNICIDVLQTGQHIYQKRLAFEELLAHHLSLRQLRQRTQHHIAVPLKNQNIFIQKFVQSLPFQLTRAQRRVFQEIECDLEKPFPMLRLIQGDVGSGKTLVAILAALLAVENKSQAAIMAPTELLAEQHFKTFERWLTPLGISVALLSGQLKGQKRKESLEKIADGIAQIIIGTHALFQNDVIFSELTLIIVDEQHRFGVHQRLALREKGQKGGCYPHQLIMTATPIPRTLAMSAYADLDHSCIDELPPGRDPVTTIIVPHHRRQEVVERIRQVCIGKRQVYWVCTLIEESEILQCQAAEVAAEDLKKSLPHLQIALVHGRMKPIEKERIMEDFKLKKYDLLVATTVIEVGVDVPNASLMVIENSERLGLAQLHQLRGRVGRGATKSHCVLLYQKPLSHQARERLATMRETNDGFLIAQKDLEIRGPGEVLGIKQAGVISMRIADLQKNRSLLPDVINVSDILLKEYPQFVKPLINRWLAQAARYGEV